MKTVLLFVIAICFGIVAGAQGDSTLKEYTGKYKFPDGSVVPETTISIENGVLMAVSANGNSELRRTQGDVFEIVAYAGTATFRRTEGKITGVQMIVGDIILEGTKTDGSVATKFVYLSPPNFIKKLSGK